MSPDPDLPRGPRPIFPQQFTSRSDFGRNGMKWGTGEEAALTRMAVLTVDELKEMGLTLAMAISWTVLYSMELRRNPRNGSARGRVRLMRRAAELLGAYNEVDEG